MGQPVKVSVSAGEPAGSSVETFSAPTSPATELGGGLLSIAINAVDVNPFQPRQRFTDQTLKQLAESIRVDGVMQPIIVRPSPAHERAGRYELVAGERRWRAARIAGLSAVPAIVRQLDDRAVAEWSLIENLQREDLNPIERAEAFQRLVEQFGQSHEAIAQRVGSDRSTITNTLRLLSLDPDVQLMVREQLLSAGQARALAGLGDGEMQVKLAQHAARRGWSVRKVEAEVRRLTATVDGGQAASRENRKSRSPTYLRDIEGQIGEQLNTRVTIRPGRKKGSGKLTIEFYSLDQFDALMARLGVHTE